MDLENQVIVVTGASRGIGRATATALAADGATVIAIARPSPELTGLEAAATDLPGSVQTVPIDVRDAKAVARVIGDIEHRHERIDVLVNVAGVERVKSLADVTDDDYEAMVDTNLRGVFHFCRAVLPAMGRRRQGHIVSVASAAGIRGFRDDAVYSASKFGVVGLMDALDEEVRSQGIRVTTICPGAVDTTLVRWVEPNSPYRSRFLRPVDVAAAIRFAVTQPAHVVVGMIVVRPLVEPPHSEMLSLDTPAARFEAPTGLG
jgi:NADP-dependent 3-hydroxy acid dehydrogenase YdfG